MNRTELGKQVRHLRETAGLTQQQVADRAGLSKGMVSSVELGNVNLTLQVLSDIAQALNTEISIRLKKFDSVQMSPQDETMLIVLENLLPRLEEGERRALELLIYALDAVHQE